MAIAIAPAVVPDVVTPPTQHELPSDDGIPMETARHRQQMNLLIETMEIWLAPRPVGYVGGNMFLYFSMHQVRNQDFRGPDFFLVLDAPRTERKSWVVWEEGRGPDVVIELLSETTAAADKGIKKQVYQNQLKVLEYYWYDPFDAEDWAGFTLQNGVYVPLAPNAQQHLVSPLLNLELVRWHGVFQQVEATWLRWATLDGSLLPTQAEMTEATRQQAEAATQRAEAAEAGVARLQALLAQHAAREGQQGE